MFFFLLTLQRRSLNAGPLQAGHFIPSPPPPKDKPASPKVNKHENEDILNAILPPRYGSVVFVLHCWARSNHKPIYINLLTSAITGSGWRVASSGYKQYPAQFQQEQKWFSWRSHWTQRSSKDRPEKQESAPSAGSSTPSALVRSTRDGG